MLMQSQWEYLWFITVLSCTKAEKLSVALHPIRDAFQPLLNVSLKFIVKTKLFVLKDWENVNMFPHRIMY